MYCPNCATENLNTARFCRTCGKDISLVPQAMNGRISAIAEDEEYAGADSALERRGRRRRRERSHEGPVSMERSITRLFVGVGFLFMAFVLSRTPFSFAWYAMLFMALMILGKGVAGLVYNLTQGRRAKLHAADPATTGPVIGPAVAPVTTSLPPRNDLSELPPRNTAELIQPPSITEGTTRHLGVEAPTRHIDDANANRSYGQ